MNRDCLASADSFDGRKPDNGACETGCLSGQTLDTYHMILIYDNIYDLSDLEWNCGAWSPWWMLYRTNPHALRLVIGRNMRIRRAELDLSQEALAQEIGTSASNLSGIERGKRNTTVDQLQKIALALMIDPADLLKARPENSINS